MITIYPLQALLFCPIYFQIASEHNTKIPLNTYDFVHKSLFFYSKWLECGSCFDFWKATWSLFLGVGIYLTRKTSAKSNTYLPLKIISFFLFVPKGTSVTCIKYRVDVACFPSWRRMIGHIPVWCTLPNFKSRISFFKIYLRYFRYSAGENQFLQMF